MSYTLDLKGEEATRKVRRGALPRRGEWLNLRIEYAWLWAPVLGVARALSRVRSTGPFSQQHF